MIGMIVEIGLKIVEPCMAILFGLIIMVIGSRMLLGLFAIDPSHEIMEKNVAFGMAALGIFMGVGIMVGMIISAIVRG